MPAEVRLTKGCVALVDDEDLPLVAPHRWCVAAMGKGHKYAVRQANGKRVILHRTILGAQPGQYVDHRNGDTLDNRRANLRLCTASENARNRRKTVGNSQFKGVCWDKRNKNWLASIYYEGCSHNIGRFQDEVAAAKAYNTEAARVFGEFAHLNEV